MATKLLGGPHCFRPIDPLFQIHHYYFILFSLVKAPLENCGRNVEIVARRLQKSSVLECR
jgi:hypothetical protein